MQQVFILYVVHAVIYGILLLGSDVTVLTDAGLFSAVLAAGLISASVWDMRHFIIPDTASLGLLLMGLLSAWWFQGYAIGWHAAAAGAWFIAMALVSQTYLRIRKIDGLGLGDAKLMAAGAAWVGPAASVSVMLMASGAGIATILGLLAYRRTKFRDLPRTGLAFGPFIALSAWFVWLYGSVV